MRDPLDGQYAQAMCLIYVFFLNNSLYEFLTLAQFEVFALAVLFTGIVTMV